MNRRLAAHQVAACGTLGLGLGLGFGDAAHAVSADDQAWIDQHPGLRFAPEQDYGPFVFRGVDDKVGGLSIDLLEHVVQQLGLSVHTLPAQPLTTILDGLVHREIDFTSSLRPTPERLQYLRFTRPYVEVPAVLVVRSGHKLTGLRAFDGRPVAVGEGYAVQGFVGAKWPRVRWRPVADDGVALDQVMTRHCDAAVLDVASLAFLTREDITDRFTVAERIGFNYALCFAVRSDWPQLVALLDQGLARMSRTEREAIVRRWLGPYAEVLRDAALPPAFRWGGAMVGGAVALGAWALWRHRAKRGAPSHARGFGASGS